MLAVIEYDWLPPLFTVVLPDGEIVPPAPAEAEIEYVCTPA